MIDRNAIIECEACGKRWFLWEDLSDCPYCAIMKMNESKYRQQPQSVPQSVKPSSDEPDMTSF